MAQIVRADFALAGPTLVTAYTDETGGAWTLAAPELWATSSTPNGPTISNGKVFCAPVDFPIYSSVVPSTADYKVSAQVVLTSDSGEVAVGARINPNFREGYFCALTNVGTMFLYRRVSGSDTALMLATLPYNNRSVWSTIGQTRSLDLIVENVGATVLCTARINGIPMISGTDVYTNRITGSGYIGAIVNGGALTGMALDSLYGDTLTTGIISLSPLTKNITATVGMKRPAPVIVDVINTGEADIGTITLGTFTGPAKPWLSASVSGRTITLTSTGVAATAATRSYALPVTSSVGGAILLTGSVATAAYPAPTGSLRVSRKVFQTIDGQITQVGTATITTGNTAVATVTNDGDLALVITRGGGVTTLESTFNGETVSRPLSCSVP
jgi:hypothetical protein